MKSSRIGLRKILQLTVFWSQACVPPQPATLFKDDDFTFETGSEYF